MALLDLLQGIKGDITDIINMDFELTNTQGDYVPSHEDPGLTFEPGRTKKAKTIETCVLYADIRNSTMLSKTHSRKEMAKLYTAFVKSALTIAEYHGGVIRNIIGDRVMVVFPQNDCFKNAVNTAISINTVSTHIIAKLFPTLNFKCGIGIDYGEKLVVKAGIPKQDKERANYKNLIWISDSANIASKLTDLANKEMVKTMFTVTYHPVNPKKFYYPDLLGSPWIPVSDLLGGSAAMKQNPNEPLYLTSQETKDITAEEFVERFDMLDGGSYFFSNGKLLRFKKYDKKITPSPILITEKVFDEYKKLDPSADAFVKGWWKVQDVTIKEYSGKVYGCGLTWSTASSLAL